MLAESTEYVEVPIGGPDAGLLLVADIAIAIVPWGEKPGSTDWHPADTYTSTHWARLLVGPAGGHLTLTPGKWDVYTRAADVPETPVLYNGMLLVT